MVYWWLLATSYMLISAGGVIQSCTAHLHIVLPDVQGRSIRFNLQGVALTGPYQANTHLLGRDILNYFAVICDREANLVTLLRVPHRYQINN